MANQENYDDFCKKLHLTIKLTEADLKLSAGIPSIPAEKVFAWNFVRYTSTTGKCTFHAPLGTG